MAATADSMSAAETVGAMLVDIVLCGIVSEHALACGTYGRRKFGDASWDACVSRLLSRGSNATTFVCSPRDANITSLLFDTGEALCLHHC